MNKLKETISIREKVSYGLGDLGCGLILALSSTYITFFYTNALGLSAIIIGSIIMFSRIADGISDIIAGLIVDKTTSKLGKCRAWIIRMTIPICVGLVLAFLVPTGHGTLTYVYVAITYNLINTVFYTMMNVPYGTLNSLMSRDQDQRMVINTFRMTIAGVGSVITNYFTIDLVQAFGGMSSQKAWVTVSCLYAVIALVVFVICFSNTKERVILPEQKEARQISIFKALQLAFKNVYWLLILIISVISILCVALTAIITNYYATYILSDVSVIGAINAAVYAPAIFVMPFLPKISFKIGKRNIALIGGIIQLLGQVIILLAPLSATWIVICTLIKGIGSSMILGTIFIMVADTIEYGEWKTGTRIEGVLYATSSFGFKVGGGVGSAIALGVIGAAGFNGLLTTQPASALSAINNLYLYYPIILFALVPILFYFYKLDHIYPQVIKDLLARKGEK